MSKWDENYQALIHDLEYPLTVRQARLVLKLMAQTTRLYSDLKGYVLNSLEVDSMLEVDYLLLKEQEREAGIHV